MKPAYKSRLVRSKLTLAQRKRTIRKAILKPRLARFDTFLYGGSFMGPRFKAWRPNQRRKLLNQPGGTYTYKIENKGRIKRYLKSRKHLARQKKRAMVAA